MALESPNPANRHGSSYTTFSVDADQYKIRLDRSSYAMAATSLLMLRILPNFLTGLVCCPTYPM